jgi:hypothetical protein
MGIGVSLMVEANAVEQWYLRKSASTKKPVRTMTTLGFVRAFMGASTNCQVKQKGNMAHENGRFTLRIIDKETKIGTVCTIETSPPFWIAVNSGRMDRAWSDCNAFRYAVVQSSRGQSSCFPHGCAACAGLHMNVPLWIMQHT